MSKSRKSYLPSKRLKALGEPHWEHAEFGEKYPALYELLTASKDGEKYRAGCRLTLFCEDGRLKAAIWDASTSQCWFSTLEDTTEPLGAIEAHLQAGKGDWREKRSK